MFENIGEVDGVVGLPNDKEQIEMWLENMNKE